MLDDLDALRLQLDWGADEAIGEAPLDRFAPRPAAAAPISAPISAPAKPAAPTRPTPQAETIEQLVAELERFEGCPLRLTATSTVRPDGNPQARVVLVGDSPGSDDDRSGRAFSGAAGALLDRVLATAGLDRDAVLKTTLVPWRPPGGRPPTESEIQACLPFFHRLIAIVRPERLVLLGSLSLRSLTGGTETMRRKRGSWVNVKIPLIDTEIPALPFPVLDQWLASPIAKQRLWSDMITLHKATTTS